MLEINKKIIQKTIELKNIDILELLRYGLDHTFIDDVFCSAIAMELMNQGCVTDCPHILNLASLVSNKYENQYERAQAIIIEATKKSNDAFEGKKQLYNKIWFYLFQLNDLLKLDVVQ